MVDVAFVCLGNMCRSPMVEATMRQRLKNRSTHDIKIHPRSTDSWNLGEPPHEGTQKTLSKHSILFDGTISELLEVVNGFDYIVATDQSNVDNIKSINPNLKGQLFKLLEFSNVEENDAPDPRYTNSLEGVYDMVLSSCDNLIDYIVKNANLKKG